MKRAIVYFAVFCLTGCGVGFVINLTDSELKEENNLILNSGFEEGVYAYQSLPDDWIVLESKEGVIFWDNSIALNGTKSLKVENPREKFTLISDAFELNPESVYYATSYLRSKQLSSKSIVMYFHAFDKHGRKVNEFRRRLVPDENWKNLTLSIGFLKSSAKFGRVTIVFPADTANTFWVDDVKCYQVHSFQKRK